MTAAQATGRAEPHTAARRLPYAVIAALLLLELAVILALNGGMLTYSLDDPYIHLAMAENIVRGHYGINLGELSAPSSSILWPFLMAPFSGTPLHGWWPLVVNAACALASVAMLWRIVGRALPALEGQGAWLQSAIVVAAALGLNQVGLVFTGMEHSLQVLLALALVDGLLVQVEERRCPWWLGLAIVVGPAVRYESTALSLAALLFLALDGRLRLAIALGVATAAPLIGFSLFLRSLGLEWLPSSVLLKSEVAPHGASPIDILVASLADFVAEFPGHPSRLVLMAAAALLAAACLQKGRRAVERRLALTGLLAVIAHLAAGRYGWFGRYEIYAMAAATTLLLYLWRDWIAGRLLSLRRSRGVLWIGLATAAAFGASLGTLVLTPFAASNIHRQQYQMHRFVTAFHDAPVAVNDLGWVSYRNDNYVLDLWGLGSLEAGSHRLARTPGWMAALTARHDADLALIYTSWFDGQVPPDWLLLAHLRLHGMQVTPAFDTVDIYAVDRSAAPALARRLMAFAETLPAGARLELTPEGRAAAAR